MKTRLSPFITNEQPGEDYFLVRPLMIDDFEKGYLQLLSQLTVVGNVTKADFEGNYFNELVTLTCR